MKLSPGEGMVVWQLFFLTMLILFILALIDILRNKFKGNNKLIWIIVILILPFLGSLLYFIIGRNQRIVSEYK